MVFSRRDAKKSTKLLVASGRMLTRKLTRQKTWIFPGPMAYRSVIFREWNSDPVHQDSPDLPSVWRLPPEFFMYGPGANFGVGDTPGRRVPKTGYGPPRRCPACARGAWGPRSPEKDVIVTL